MARRRMASPQAKAERLTLGDSQGKQAMGTRRRREVFMEAKMREKVKNEYMGSTYT